MRSLYWTPVVSIGPSVSTLTAMLTMVVLVIMIVMVMIYDEAAYHGRMHVNASQVLSSCPAAEQRLLRGKALECVSLVGSTVDKERSVGRSVWLTVGRTHTSNIS